MAESPWLSVKDYAALYRIHPNTVRIWILQGKVTSYRNGRVVRVKNEPKPNRRVSLTALGLV